MGSCKSALGTVLIAMAVGMGGNAHAERPDPWITTKVKIALLTSTGVSARDIHVDTTAGRVTLYGMVSSQQEKEKAESTARGIEGVTEVRNLLAVVSESEEPETRATDQDIRERVEAALAEESSLADSEIEVAAVNDGVVLLSGKASSLSAHQRALAITSDVAGVRKIASEIESPDELADAEVQREIEDSEGETDSTLESAASDLWTTAEVKTRLMASEAPAFDINVDTRNGVVTLFGTVPTEQAKAVAENVARQSRGTRRVKNALQVVPDTERSAVQYQDKELRELIEKKLSEHADLEDAQVNVEVSKGVVRLTGRVQSTQDRTTVLSLANDTAGIQSVIDDLELEEEVDVGAGEK